MRTVKKAREILRTHGFRGLAQRALWRVWRNMMIRSEATLKRSAWKTLTRGRSSERAVYFPRHDAPLVSIIIPVHNGMALTAACLNAILHELDSIPCEVIVVDDASTDDTAAYLKTCTGIRVIRHALNQGYVRSANDGSVVARGKYVCFLNNDTIVTHNWLRPLLQTFENAPSVGAVGSMLLAADGKVAEAGAIIWSDGYGWNYGRGRQAADPSVAFFREVDYCSAACLMVSTDVFRDVGGFSEIFSPGYYEDVDLCFRLRKAGYRVYYQPESAIIHLEGGTAGSDPSSGMKRFQNSNRVKFVQEWQAELHNHFPSGGSFVETAARRLCGGACVLVIDSFVPFHDRSAGARRTAALMRLMRESGYHVIFLSDDGCAHEPYASRVRADGVELVTHAGDTAAAIRKLPIRVDLAWICRPDLMKKYAPVLRMHSDAKLIYDTVDLHFVRLHREELVTGKSTNWREMRLSELALAQEADHVVVTSVEEKLLLCNAGIEPSVVPIVEVPTNLHPPFETRKDLLFIGNFTHAPNVDAAIWLANQIMPLIWQHMPHASLVLSGADPTPAVRRLANDRIHVPGYLPDVGTLFDNARVFIAPLRFGAGMKGKVIQSLSHGLPVITTSLGAEGIGLTSGENALIADDERGLANAVVRLYNDADLWKRLGSNGRGIAAQYTPQAVKPRLEQALSAALNQ